MGRKERKTQRRKLENEFLRDRYIGRSATPGVHEFVIVLDNLKVDFNIGKIYRSAYAFGAAEIHVIGTKWFDPSPAKGALKYIPSKFFATPEESFADLKARGYEIFVFDLGASATLGQAPLPRKSAFVLGSEGAGITFDCAGKDVTIVTIPQFGRMESLNVSVAASIAMFEWVRQNSAGPAREGTKSG